MPVDVATAYDYLFKLVLVGDSGVGKSSLLVRFTVPSPPAPPPPPSQIVPAIVAPLLLCDRV